MYLPFARLLQERIDSLFPLKDPRYVGTKKDPRRRKVAKILGVPYQTLCTWLVGNALPGTIARKLMVGSFLGWIEDVDTDGQGIKNTLDYFEGDSPRSTPEERARHIRARENVHRVRSIRRAKKKARERKRDRRRE